MTRCIICGRTLTAGAVIGPECRGSKAPTTKRSRVTRAARRIMRPRTRRLHRPYLIAWAEGVLASDKPTARDDRIARIELAGNPSTKLLNAYLAEDAVTQAAALLETA